MDPKRYQRLKNLVNRALELPEIEQDVFLQQECEDIELLAEARDLLLHSTTDPEGPLGDPAKQSDLPEMVGKKIGPYQIIKSLGEGGMGVVYLAGQSAPLRRKVALKVIKLGMDTREVIARFGSERQALALMEHPNIAKVYDAGATDAGRPFFVMEYIPGVPLNRYCDAKKLGLAGRLNLFIQVCSGVQHAHRKGIIHRDLKPGNILVTEVEGRPVPKIIDFGVAKATSQHLAVQTLFTQVGQMIGTPEYMSPEQAGSSDEDVDTRSDVYSLGVMLYELLTGAVPLERREIMQAGLERMALHVQNEIPKKPSTRIDTEIKQSGRLANIPISDTRAWAKRIRGDLDWITMKALEKDPNRRYGSVQELAEDIRRHSENRPVLASSPSTAYRLGKFLKRHRIGVSATATIFVLLVAFAIMMTVQANRIAQERDRALAAEKRALTEAETAAEVSQFLVDIFKVSDPSEAHGNSVTAREILDLGAVRIKETLTGQPGVQARLMETMGSVYFNLGFYDRALELAEEARRIRQSLYAGDHPEVAQSLLLLSEVQLQRGEFDKAEELNSKALAMNRRVLGNEHPKTAECLQSLAVNLKRQNRLDEAETAYREALAIRRNLIPPDPVVTASTLTSLGELLRLKDQLDEAEVLHQEALNLTREVESIYHPVVRTSLNNLALVFEARESYDEAEGMLREVVQIDMKLFGTRSPRYATSVCNLAGILKKAGKLDEAEEIHRQALAIRRDALAADHPDLATSLNNLSTVLHAKGELDEAAILLAEALEVIRKAMGEDHPRVGITLYNLGRLLNEKGDYPAARRRFQEAEPRMARMMSADHWRMGNLRSMIGLCLAHEGRFAEGEFLVVGGYETVQAARGDADRRTRVALERVVQFYELANRTTEAREYNALLKQKSSDE